MAFQLPVLYRLKELVEAVLTVLVLYSDMAYGRGSVSRDILRDIQLVELSVMANLSPVTKYMRTCHP